MTSYSFRYLRPNNREHGKERDGMEQGEKVSFLLMQKIEILKKIAAKTEIQCRFIHKREMTGLKRAIRERDDLIEEIVTIDRELARDQSWKNIQHLMPILREIDNQQQAIIDRSHQVLQEAIIEKSRIASEFKHSKVRRQVKSQYVNPWAVVARGSRINERG